MPYTKITEVDNTTVSSISARESHAVYIPGFATLPDFNTYNEPIYLQSISDLHKLIGNAPYVFDNDMVAHNRSSLDLSYILAYYLLNAGLPVYYEVPDLSEQYTLPSVVNNVTMPREEAAMIEWLSDVSNLEQLADRSLFPFLGFITSGGYAASYQNYETGKEGGSTVNIIAQNMIQVAERRQDVVALIDHDIDLIKLDKVFDAINGTNDADQSARLTSKYAAAFTPWCNLNVKKDWSSATNKLSDNKIAVPGSFCYLMAFATNVNRTQAWLAAAGSMRGTIPFLLEPLAKYGELAINSIAQKKTGISINTICNVEPFGYVVWGNRTLNNNIDGLVPSSFLNIRQLISLIRKQTYLVCRRYTFEQNSDILWLNFRSKIAQMLDSMVVGNGIRAYDIARVAAPDMATLSARITIVPIAAVENFEIEISLSDSISITESVVNS